RIDRPARPFAVSTSPARGSLPAPLASPARQARRASRLAARARRARPARLSVALRPKSLGPARRRQARSRRRRWRPRGDELSVSSPIEYAIALERLLGLGARRRVLDTRDEACG